MAPKKGFFKSRYVHYMHFDASGPDAGAINLKVLGEISFIITAICILYIHACLLNVQFRRRIF